MVTIAQLQAKKGKEKITMLTAYSAAMAGLLVDAGIDMLLVGDSLGMVFQGKNSTLAVTVDEMIYHAQAVRRGASDAFVVVDMPFMSYQTSIETALVNAGRIVKEADANAVKIEGALPQTLEAIARMVGSGIPVMGHLGFTPQSVNVFSGYKVQAKTEDAIAKLIHDAKAMEQAGAFALVIEMVPAKVAAQVTAAISIPVISCGAGIDCDGQVLVIDDILGMYPKSPKFSKQYLHLRQEIITGVRQYIAEVQTKKFPTKEHSF